MAGPRYTIAQTRARVAALEIAANYLAENLPDDIIELQQTSDIITKLRNEVTRLKAKAQEVRNGD